MKKENIPNALTLVRIALIPVFVVILTFGHSYTMHILAAFIFAFASITDYLDGYLARKWEVITNRAARGCRRGHRRQPAHDHRGPVPSPRRRRARRAR